MVRPIPANIYMAVQNEAMAKLLESDVEPSSVELALYVIGRLGLDPKDLKPVEELVALLLIGDVKNNPQFVAAWREMMARRDRDIGMNRRKNIDDQNVDPHLAELAVKYAETAYGDASNWSGDNGDDFIFTADGYTVDRKSH